MCLWRLGYRSNSRRRSRLALYFAPGGLQLCLRNHAVHSLCRQNKGGYIPAFTADYGLSEVMEGHTLDKGLLADARL